MKITTLIENSQDEKGLLKNEHGLSIFIESSYGNILFDTGKSGDFVENAKKMNIDLGTIKTLVLSHAHYDHCGGVKRLLDTYNVAPNVIVGNTFFKNSDRYHYSDGALKTDFSGEVGYKYVGIDFGEEYLKEKNISINYIKENMYKVNDEVYIFTNFKKIHSIEKENKNMLIKVDKDQYITDSFDDEVSIGLKTKDGIVILLGCAHPGFLNIIDSIKEFTGEKICGVIGGTHLVEGDVERINKSADYLEHMGLKSIGLSHCTGEKAVKIFEEKCKNTFTNRTGTVIEF